MELKPTILVVDDEFSIRESFDLILSHKYRVIQAASGEGALKQAADHVIDLVYLDVRMPGIDGIETLKRLKEISPQTEVIMVTAVNDVQKASLAINLGAYDYVVKPFDVEKISSLTAGLLRKKGLLSVVRGIGMQTIGQLIGLKVVAGRIVEISKTTNWGLISGEPGVEKEWVARLIHQNSGNIKPFSVLDLKELSDSAIDKKLFGKSEGITTADIKKEIGLVDFSGTIFIDNIELLNVEFQAQLAKLSIRVIAGTSRAFSELNLCKEFGDKITHEQISIPPLRERSSDIPLFVNYFLDEGKNVHGSKIKEILPQASDILSSYSWPGNVLELKSVIERLVLVTKASKVEPRDLPVNILINSSVPFSMPLEDAYSEFEGDFIKAVMEYNSNNKVKASKMLRVSPQVLEAKL